MDNNCNSNKNKNKNKSKKKKNSNKKKLATLSLKKFKEKSIIRRNLISKIVGVNPANEAVDLHLSQNERELNKIFKQTVSSAIKKVKVDNETTTIDNNKKTLTATNSNTTTATSTTTAAATTLNGTTTTTTTTTTATNTSATIATDCTTTANKPIDEEWNDINSKVEDDKKPKNDYCQHFIDTCQRPHNFIRDAGLNGRFEEYPKLRELIKLKDELIDRTNTMPIYLETNFDKFSLTELECEFDVILVEPPLKEYQRTNGVNFKKFMSWEEIKNLDIEHVAAQRAFIFLWCGSAEGLDKGRECLKKWGFRRCEDICWIKTNKKNPVHNRNLEPGAIFQRTKEHCLMGIKGTVRRSVDNDFIHANVDIDLIITEEPEYGCPDKPEEIFHIIEHFCLGKRRLYLFGRDNTVRPGWLTLGADLTASNFDKSKYKSLFEMSNSLLTGCTERIDALRPKSPPIKLKQQNAPPLTPQQQAQQLMFCQSQELIQYIPNNIKF